MDQLDTACASHDRCLANECVVAYFPRRVDACNRQLCAAAASAAGRVGTCMRDYPLPGPPRDACVDYANRILAACTLMYPRLVRPVVGPPQPRFPRLPDTDGDDLPDIVDPHPRNPDGDGDGASDCYDPYPNDPTKNKCDLIDKLIPVILPVFF